MRIHKNHLQALFIAGTLILTGCKGSDTSGPTPPVAPTHTVYVLNNDDSSISTYWADGDGRLFLHNPPGGAVRTPDNPLDFHYDARNSRLYTIGGFSSRERVGLFNAAVDGVLTSTVLPGWPLPVPDDEYGLAFDPQFRFAFAPDANHGTITAYLVQPDGTLRLNPSGINPAGCGGFPESPVVDATGTFLYVTGQERVWTYRIQADGSLVRNVAPLDVLGAPTTLCLAPNGQAMYLLDYARGIIHLLKIQPDGSPMAPLPENDIQMTGLYPWRIAIDSGGRFVYVASANQIWSFKVNADGTLIANDLPGGPVPTGKTPYGITLNPEGKVMYVPNQDDNTVSVFSVGSDGRLTQLQAPVPTGGTPDQVIVR